MPLKDVSLKNERNREWMRRDRVANPEKYRTRDRLRRAHDGNKRREYNATLRHGITRTIRDWMYESQGRACAGCGKTVPNDRLDIDHDHSCCPGFTSCGSCVRGLVCRPCNKLDVLAMV